MVAFNTISLCSNFRRNYFYFVGTITFHQSISIDMNYADYKSVPPKAMLIIKCRYQMLILLVIKVMKDSPWHIIYCMLLTGPSVLWSQGSAELFQRIGKGFSIAFYCTLFTFLSCPPSLAYPGILCTK
jgi:hypothetical protein